MANIPIGTKGESQLLVTSEVAINFMGTEGARVLSTPHMIGLLLWNALDTLFSWVYEPSYPWCGFLVTHR